MCKIGMICFAKPVLTEDLCIIQKEEFSIICYTLCVKCTLDERPSIFITDKPILSAEKMIHEDYYHKGSVGEKIAGRNSQGA
jgi:hypothetical protein